MQHKTERLNHEIEHGKKISKNAEDVWNWSSPAGKLRAERRARYFIEFGKISKNDKVLEIGCGTGLFTQKVHTSTSAKITATDLSEDLLNIARAKVPGVSFINDDAMDMKFESESFDVVFGSSILHHLEMDTAMKEIYRVLKPNGRMIFAEPNMLNPQIFIQKNIPFIKKWLGDSPDESAIVRWKFTKLMHNAGFKKINIFPYDFLHPITPVFLVPAVNKFGKLIEKIPFLKEIAGSVIIYGEK
jgi:ubiquinone/menaquinone biosynthesis C-methylase UbiE